VLTWYDGETGERIELSAATFANWVAKTANLLRDGIGVPEAPHVALALPAHWQAFPIAHAVWALGGTVVLIDDAATTEGLDPVDLVVRRAADDHVNVDADDELVLALRPLGAPGQPVASPAYDYDREVPVHGDVFSGTSVASDALALIVGDHALTQAALVQRALPPSAESRTMVRAADRALAPFITATVAGLIGNGVVLIAGNADDAALERIAATERITD
jgi:uncharacterized protein (TIGR03089 family)